MLASVYPYRLIWGQVAQCTEVPAMLDAFPFFDLTSAINGLSSVLRIGNFPVDIGVPEFSGTPFVFCHGKFFSAASLDSMILKLTYGCG